MRVDTDSVDVGGGRACFEENERVAEDGWGFDSGSCD